MGDLVLVTGGARSGKSAHAEMLAAATAAPVTYLATMERRDDAELALRIEAHRQRRPSDWRTVEVPRDVAAALRRVPPADTVLLDCLTLWVSNLLFREVPHAEAATADDWQRAIDACLAAADALCDLQATRPGTLIAVTNEVGMGIVPGDPLSRAFRDAAGLVNQRVAARATRVTLMVSGRALALPANSALSTQH